MWSEGLWGRLRTIFSLAIIDFQNRYLGARLGILWAFMYPFCTALILILVFRYGLKARALGDIPFTDWLVFGLIPWFFISDTLTQGPNVLKEYQFLLTKIKFPIQYLPMIKIISALIIHLGVLLLVTLVMIVFFDYTPSIYLLQLPFFTISTCILLLGLVWMTSFLVFIFRDLSQLITILIQLLFWGTPIVWSVNAIPPKYLFIIKLNPIAYIIKGYRSTFINKNWFWDSPAEAFLLLMSSILIFLIGFYFFRKNQAILADFA